MGTAVPETLYTQQQLLDMGGRDRLRERLFLNSDIDSRHLYFGPEYRGVESIDDMQARARRGAAELGGAAIRTCLERASAKPRDIGFLATSTCTVTLCPQLDTWFIRDLDLSPSIRRAHIGDTGCAAAMVALQAAWNHQHAYPGQKSVVAAVEVCSAALYRDGTVEAAVGEAIFGDGAAALCLAWEGAGFEVLGHRTLIRSEHIGLTGFDFPGARRRLVLSKELPAVGAVVLEELVASLLEEHGVKKSEVGFWILHSAGRKVLDVAKERLGLREDDLRFSREVFRSCGNMSSPTVVFALDRVMASGQPRPGDIAVMAAMGAGFAAEAALLRWVE